ncbi:CBS domain-containing protein [Mesobacillus jeotgali]|uniref:CBS domain-containing protein n=1 Tax=Mesobacillus jeotgali TaxID=129985 RepID=UPI002147C19B|nr:CBS domain-containing protein [Mesobacillus jeotgali]
MAKNTQVEHRSNRTSSKKQKSQQSRKANEKRGSNSYLRTNPNPVTENHRLKRVDENEDQAEKSPQHNTGKAVKQNSGKQKTQNVKESASQESKQKGSRRKAGQSKKAPDPNAENGTGKNQNTKSPQDQNFKTSGDKELKSSQDKNGNSAKVRESSKSSQAKNQEKTSPDKNSKSAKNIDSKSGPNEEVKHKEQSGKFETAFNRIHKALKEMVKGTDSDAFVELLYSGYKNHSLIRKYKSELHQFAKLRNAIVHERVNADYYIAEPHIEVIEQIEEIAKEFEKPQTALSIATSPVFYYYEDAYLKDVLKVINKFDFTRFPVYDKEDKYVALLTSTEIIQWMAKHFSDNVVHFEDVRVKELLTKGKNYFVTFVDEEASLYHIEELFERYHTRGKKLQAVIITETGDRHGKPIGVITPWDLLDSDPDD